MADMGSSYVYGTGAGSINRESVMDLVTNVDPFDTPLLNMAPKVPAKHTTEEWLTDTLAATSTAGRGEGAAFAQAAISAPSRVTNITQIFGKDVLVSETQQAVSPYGFSDTFLYEIMKGTREVMRNIEKRILSASGGSASGEATAASAQTGRVMKSLDDFLTTNALHADSTALGQSDSASGASAVSLPESSFNTMLQVIYTAGGNPGFVFAAPVYKRLISGWVGSITTGATAATVQLFASERQIVRSVNSYLSDFGLINIVLDRWSPQATNTTSDNNDNTGTLHFLELPRVQVAFLRPLRFRKLAADGDRVRGQIVGELTLRVLNQAGSGRISGINNRLV
jgi:hypothetical protein